MPSFQNPITKKDNEASITTQTVYNDPKNTPTTITEINGTKWEGTYYQQILKQDDIPRNLDLQLDPSLQQYRKINNAIVYLSGPPTFTINQSTGDSEITATAIMFPSIVPNKGDHFVAKLNDGNFYIFYVENQTPLKFNKNTAHEIDLKLFSVYDQRYIDNLNVKTVEIAYYNDNDSSLSHKAPSKTKPVDIAKIVRVYFDYFYDPFTQTFVYPDEDNKIYDPFVVEFMDSIIPRDLMLTMPDIRVYSTNNTEYKNDSKSIYSLLLQRICYPLKSINKTSSQMRQVSVSDFTSLGVYGNIGTSDFDKVVWPKGVRTLNSKALCDIDTDALSDYYVASKAFYEKDEPRYTVLDQFIARYINNVEIKYNEIVDPVNQLYENDDKKELFYQLPVYLVLALKTGYK